MKKRSLGFIAGCFLLLAPAVKAVASEGIQMGPVLLFPLLSASVTYDDNIGLVSDNPESGWVTSIAPSLRLLLPVRRFNLNVEGGLDFLTYPDVDQDNSMNWFVGAAVGAEFPGGLSFKIADKHAERSLLRTQEFGVGEDTTVNTLSATAAYAIRSALRLELSGIRKAPTYDVSTQRDRVETTLQADLLWRFRPRISGLVEGSFAVYAYDNNHAKDSSETQVAIGLTWEVTARSTGFLKTGFQWKRFDDEDQSLGIENGSYYTLLAGLRYFFTPRTLLVVDLSRASQEADFPENPYYLRTAVDARFSQKLTPKLHARAGVRYTSDEYPNTTSYDNPYDTTTGLESDERTDTTLFGSLSLGFDVTRWLSLELMYSDERRNSSFDTFDFDVSRISLSAKAAF